MSEQDVVNFSAGPAMLPPSVVQTIKNEFDGFYDGMSVAEISHRSPQVLALKERLENRLRHLLNVPEDMHILMMHGGARGQFSAVPLNLLGNEPSCDYLISGYWGELAAKAAQQYCADVRSHAMDMNGDFAAYLEALRPKGAYVHYTDNETISGIEFPYIKRLHECMVTDVTSNILSRPIDWDIVDVAYASAQKNLGIAGCTFVFIRDSFLDRALAVTPGILSYEQMVKTDSLLNTAPVFCWYVTDLLLDWVEQNGGLDRMSQLANLRSKLLYETVDKSSLYQNNVPTELRSRLNVPFTLAQGEQAFLKQAEEKGLYFLKGHRSLGGIRASMYNAMPLESVERLVDFMKEFERAL